MSRLTRSTARVLACAVLSVCGVAVPAQADPWVSAGSVTPTGGAPRTWAAAVQTSSGDILALGGSPVDASGDSNGQVHLLRQNNWSSVAALDGPKIAQGAGIDALGRVIVYAGFDLVNGDSGGARPYTVLDGYAGDIAQRAEQAPVAFCAFAQDAQHRLYTLGGSDVGGNATTYVDRYDATTNTWTVLAPMLTPVGDAAGVYDGQGHVLVIGGINSSGTARSANVARYDIASNAWSDSAVPDLPVATSGLRAVLGADGRVYAMGGKTGPMSTGSVVANVWVLDVNTNSWQVNSGGAMLTARQHFGAVLNALDSSILVIGGENDAGGTNLCESLYTPVCPAIVKDTEAHGAWLGSNAGLSAVFSGGHVMTYQWFRNGAALSDGDLGGRVSGAQSSALTVHAVQTSDEGSYHVVATNPCGSTASSVASLTVRVPPSAADLNKWRVQVLHPPGSPSSSIARAVANGRIVGEITTGPNPLYPQRSYFTHAAYWVRESPTSPFTMHDVNNPTTVQSGMLAISPDGMTAVGYWYHPYTVPVYGNGFYMRPYVWTFNASGSYTEQELWCRAEYGAAHATDGVRTVGYSYGDFGDPSYQEYWGPQPALNIPQSTPHSLSGIGMGLVLGSLNQRATVWSNAVAIDLTPPGATAGWIGKASDGQLVGSATFGTPHGVVWDGLSPAAITDFGASTQLSGVHKGLQSGSEGSRAAIWAGSVASKVDLHALLASNYTLSFAHDVWVDDASGRIIVCGQAFNSTAPVMYNAVAWVYDPNAGTPCAADFNSDSAVSVQDIFDFLNAWFAGATSADVNHADGVTVQDIFDFLNLWFTGC